MSYKINNNNNCCNISTTNSSNSKNNKIVKVLTNKSLFRLIVNSKIVVQNIDSYKSKYHHWNDLKSIVQNEHYGLLAYRIKLQHHISVCNDGIRLLCSKLKSHEIFSCFYQVHQSLFLDHELLFLAIQCGSLEIVKLLASQTEPIRFSRSRKVVRNGKPTSETLLQWAWSLGHLDIYFYLLHTENQDIIYTQTIHKAMIDQLMIRSDPVSTRTLLAKGSQDLINTLIQHAHQHYTDTILQTNDIQLIMQLLPNHKFSIDSLDTYFKSLKPKQQSQNKSNNNINSSHNNNNSNNNIINLDQQLSLLFLASNHFRIELNNSDLSIIVEDILDRLKSQLKEYKLTRELASELTSNKLEELKKHLTVIEIYRLYLQLSRSDVASISSVLSQNIIEMIKLDMFLAVPFIIDLRSSSSILIEFSKYSSVELFKFAHLYFKEKHKQKVSQTTINSLFKHQYQSMQQQHKENPLMALDIRMLETLNHIFNSDGPTTTVLSPWENYRTALTSVPHLKLFVKICQNLPDTLPDEASHLSDDSLLQIILFNDNLSSRFNYKSMCQYAARNGYYPIVETLLRHRREYCNDCLYGALFGRHLNIVNLLLGNGYSPSFQDWMMIGKLGDCDLFELVRPHIVLDGQLNFDLVNIRVASVHGHLTLVQHICESYDRQLTKNEDVGNLNHPALIAYYAPSAITENRVLMKAVELSLMNSNNDAFLCLFDTLDQVQKKYVLEEMCPKLTMKLVERSRILIISLLLRLGAKFLLNDQLFNCIHFKDNPTLQTLLYLNRFADTNQQNPLTSSSSSFLSISPNSLFSGDRKLKKSILSWK